MLMFVCILLANTKQSAIVLIRKRLVQTYLCTVSVSFGQHPGQFQPVSIFSGILPNPSPNSLRNMPFRNVPPGPRNTTNRPSGMTQRQDAASPITEASAPMEPVYPLNTEDENGLRILWLCYETTTTGYTFLQHNVDSLIKETKGFLKYCNPVLKANSPGTTRATQIAAVEAKIQAVAGLEHLECSADRMVGDLCYLHRIFESLSHFQYIYGPKARMGELSNVLDAFDRIRHVVDDAENTVVYMEGVLKHAQAAMRQVLKEGRYSASRELRAAEQEKDLIIKQK